MKKVNKANILIIIVITFSLIFFVNGCNRNYSSIDYGISDEKQCESAGYYCGHNSLSGGCENDLEVGLCSKSVPCCKNSLCGNGVCDSNENQGRYCCDDCGCEIGDVHCNETSHRCVVHGIIEPAFCGSLTKSGIMNIAQSSECTENATLNSNEQLDCNNDRYAWIGLNLEKSGCNPACVVDTESRTAEINWRCTGLLEERCTKTGTNENLTLTEMNEIYRASECNELGRADFSMPVCDNTLGIYWQDFNLTMSPGNETVCNLTCVPSCSVNVATKLAEIGCRC